MVGILGGGSWGTTLAKIAKGEVLIWTRDEEVEKSINKNNINPKYFNEHILPKTVYATTSLKDIKECDVIVIALPAQSVRSVMRELSKYIDGDKILVNSSKGIEVGTGKRISEIIKEETCTRRIGVLSGPNLADEIMMGFPSAAVAASRMKEVQEKIYEIFNSPFFKIYLSYDVVGVELGGAIKNIYAIASGIAEELGFGTNTISFLLSRAGIEMMRFGKKFKAMPETFMGLSGMGDLIATAMGKSSRNKKFGRLLAKGYPPEEALREVKQVVEGYSTVKSVMQIAENGKIYIPIAEAVWRIVHLKEPLNEVIKELLQKEVKYEFEGIF